MGKFGIIVLVMCTFFIPLMLTNSPAQAVNPLPAAAVSPAAADDCSVDPKFYVAVGQVKSDSSFGVKTDRVGVDTGFNVPVCQGVSGTSPGK